MYIAKLIVTDDDTGMVVAMNDVTFNPANIDNYGTEENVEGLVGKVMRQARHEYRQQIIEAEHNADAAGNYADHMRAIRAAETV